MGGRALASAPRVRFDRRRAPAFPAGFSDRVGGGGAIAAAHAELVLDDRRGEAHDQRLHALLA